MSTIELPEEIASEYSIINDTDYLTESMAGTTDMIYYQHCDISYIPLDSVEHSESDGILKHYEALPGASKSLHYDPKVDAREEPDGFIDDISSSNHAEITYSDNAEHEVRVQILERRIEDKDTEQPAQNDLANTAICNIL